MTERVAILGASDNPARFSHRAFDALRAHGHTALPVSPKLDRLDGVAVAPTLSAIEAPIDTITVYLRPELSEPLAEDIVAAAPRRVIFNPGSESPVLRKRLEQSGIRVQWECTLVLLREGRYE